MKKKPVAKKRKYVPRKKSTRVHTRTAYEASLQHNADLRYALMQIRDMERIAGSPGMSSKGTGSLEAAQEIARKALE